VADGDYGDVMRPSGKLVLRGVYFPSVIERAALRWGLEMSADFIPHRDEFVPDGPGVGQLQFYRVRLIIGPRFVLERPSHFLFARAGLGLDLLGIEEDSRVGNFEVHDSDEDVGLAFELGGGIAWRVGPVTLGVQVALPMALQRSSGTGDVSAFDADWFAFDIDVVGTVGSTL
jgi:hypothetical protein